MNPSVDKYINNAGKWQDELLQLREIAQASGLQEELKWGTPCYTSGKKNIVLIHSFKEYCALLFFKGALLKDPHKLLVQQSANTQATRQLRFTKVQDILKLKAVIHAYIQEAVAIEKAGLQVTYIKSSELVPTEEFAQKLAELPELKTAFYGLTPGRQRAYHLYFAQPKQFKTRAARVEKCVPLILQGKGLNDNQQ